MHWHVIEKKIFYMLKVFTSESKGSFIPWGLPEREVWHVKQNVLANDINRQYFPMSIFSTLDFVIIESSSFHNSIPKVLHTCNKLKTKKLYRSLKKLEFGWKKPVHCRSLISKSYNLSSFEPSLMHVQEGVFKLLYWPNNACSFNWLIYQPTDRWNQYILFS